MTTRTRRLPRDRQRGGVTLLLVVVLIVLAALIGALAVRGSSSELRMAGSQRLARSGFYCAEAGLNYARPLIAANYLQWSAMLNYPNGPAITGLTYPITADIDGDPNGGNDFIVTIQDNYDEPLPQANNPYADNDLSVIIVSKCISTTLVGGGERTLKEIITYTGQQGADYRNQAGHSSSHSGNEN
jgi:hypothetical protein